MRNTIQGIQDMKRHGDRIAMLTAYDYSTAKLVDAAGVPMILVGDTLGMVMLGYETTLHVTMDDMVRHIQAVVRGTSQALVVGDLPFMSYQASSDDAVRNAGRFLQDGGAQAVKLEGGVPMAATVRRIVDCGIPVMGHIGLTPQSVNQLGGYKVQGRTPEVASRLLDDARALEEAGAFSIVLECVPAPLSARITEGLSIPTIGIGAGPHCDGQVQVIHDILGLFSDLRPRHARRYAEVGDVIREALQQYVADVVAGTFPTAKESFSMDERILDTLSPAAASSA
ncbi:MAG: 3-methyl-2-oxobutanoate hydroxymethyltransferase [Chloroflexi bacterium]|nr:3-methyl-2-oxobutanoate hydroxymethyltransferase [Chloroflexota bacterium]